MLQNPFISVHFSPGLLQNVPDLKTPLGGQPQAGGLLAIVLFEDHVPLAMFVPVD